MSKASTPVKVLRTALKRVQKGWIPGAWARPTGQKDENGKDVWGVCLEGAIFGFCKHPTTEAQRKAADVCLSIINERSDDKWVNIPEFNDTRATQDDIIEIIKLGIIRLETDKMMDDFTDDYIEEDETKELLG